MESLASVVLHKYLDRGRILVLILRSGEGWVGVDGREGGRFAFNKKLSSICVLFIYELVHSLKKGVRGLIDSGFRGA